jgi:hypothetical protein
MANSDWPNEILRSGNAGCRTALLPNFEKKNELQIGFIMKTKFKMSISSLQRHVVYVWINGASD